MNHMWRWYVCPLILIGGLAGSRGYGLEIFVDNNNANNTGGSTFAILSGGSGPPSGWRTSASTGGYYGTDYAFKETTTFGNDFGEVEWRPALPAAGAYEVAVRYTQGGNRSTAAPYTVDYDGGSQTIAVNQQTGGGQWVVIGTFNFAAGTSGRVRLHNDTSGSVVIADAVRFTSVEGGPAAEFRGIWITRFEWPSTNLTTVQNRINTFFQNARNNNFNAVLMQVRGQADTLYPSPYEPWSPILSSSGNTPAGWGNFDPLQYAIQAAHSRGLEFHAYINTHVAWQSGSQSPPSNPNHLYYQHCNAADPAHRDWLIHDQNGNPVQYEESDYVWMAPGVPEFQAYTRKQVMYVIENYDVDGVHFDRIRCPGPEYSWDPISQARKAGEGNPDGLNHADWTRDQITRFLRDMYAQIMEVKPHVKVSSAPLGLYWYPRYQQYGYPQSNCGFQYGYSCVYQDAQAWLAAGAQDFIVPQIYWPDAPWRATNPHFSQILPDWLSHRAGRHIYAGQTTGVGHTSAALVHEINVTRTPDLNGNTGQGNVIFSYGGVNNNNWWSAYSGPGGPYEQPVPVPEMPWKTNPTDGIIIGNVTGPDGVSPVVDAQITRTGSSYTALSSGDGLYSFLLVPPGTYTLTCNKIGLGQKVIHGVSVSAGKVTRVNISYGPPAVRTITGWASVRTHSPGTDVSIPLDASAAGNGGGGATVEPRLGGIQRIDITFDGPISIASPADIFVTGQSTVNGAVEASASYIPTVSAAGNTLSLAFAPGTLPDATCYTIAIGPGALHETLSGDADCRVRALAGDTTGSGDITLSDVVLTWLNTGQAVGDAPVHDVDLSGTIDIADALAIKAAVSSPVQQVICP